MEKIVFDSEYFNPKDTLTCGQIFRFTPFGKGYKVFSTDKCAYLYVENESTVVECDACDLAYFRNFFDLERDYKSIYSSAVSENIPALTMAANKAKGIRILNQDCTEMLFSFIISQNNNIPRISGIIDTQKTKYDDLVNDLVLEKCFLFMKRYIDNISHKKTKIFEVLEKTMLV